MFYGDFNGDGSVALVESWYDESLRSYAPILNVWTIAQSMPWLLEKFNSYEAFSRASVENALGERGLEFDVTRVRQLHRRHDGAFRLFLCILQYHGARSLSLF